MQTLWNFVNTPRNRYQMYLFLNKPRTFLAIAYQIWIIILIVVCILITMFMSRDEGSPTSYIVLFWFDLSVLIFFTFEYFLRVWASTVLPKYSGKYGVLRIVMHPIYLIDATVIGLTIACMVLDVHMQQLSAGLRGFRMLQIFDNRYRMWRLLFKSIWSERFQLTVAIYFCIVMTFGFGFLMYFIEQPYNYEFNTVANSVWWAVVTFTTVGYGNAAPSTTAGKIVTAFAMIVGVGIYALPAGIIGASLALKVEEDTCTHSSLRQNYAATLLQNAWRVYRIEKVLRGRRPSHQPVLVRLSSYNQNLQFSGTPNVPQPHERQFLDALAVQFIFLLKFHLNKSRFRLTVEISDTNNFYETYMQTSWQQTNLILSLQNTLEHLQDHSNDTRQIIEAILHVLQPSRPVRSASGSEGGDGPDGGPDGGPGESGPSDAQLGQEGGPDQASEGEGEPPGKHEIRLRKRRIPVKRARNLFCCWSCLHKIREQKRRNRSREEAEAEVVPVEEAPQEEMPLLDLAVPSEEDTQSAGGVE